MLATKFTRGSVALPLALGLAFLGGCELATGSTDYCVEGDDDCAKGSSEHGTGAETSNGSTSTVNVAAVTSSDASSGATTGGGGGCTNHWDCPADQICLAGQCNIAWGRTFRFTFCCADISGTDPTTGSAWDPLGGAPDPFVSYYENMVWIQNVTNAIDDTFTPAWFQDVDVLLQADGVEITFAVWDLDTDVDPPDYVTQLTGPPAAWLNVVRDPALAGTLVSDDQGFTILVAPL